MDMLLFMYHSGVYKSSWTSSIETILCENGHGNIWHQPQLYECKQVCNLVKQTLRDLYVKVWNVSI